MPNISNSPLPQNYKKCLPKIQKKIKLFSENELPDRGEGPLTGHVVEKHHTVRPPEVSLGHAPEPEINK